MQPGDYRISLNVYSGPLDLLLFLIRREEVDIYDIPIARITEQYLEYVELLKRIDPDVVSEFLVLAATLMEIKSRMLLPRQPADDADVDAVDPRLELVQQLLEYKKFKDAARELDESAAARAERFERAPAAPPAGGDEHELGNLDIWDLFDAFNKLLQQTGQAGAQYQIEIDDTPVALHAEDLLDSLNRAGGGQMFADVFEGRPRSEMIGLFLALLELIRQRRIRAEQDRPFGPIMIRILDNEPVDAAMPDGEEHVDKVHAAGEEP